MKYLSRSPQQIATAIKQYRRQQGFTQTQLGERVGMRQATISKLESGSPATQIQTLLDVMMALNLEMIIQPRSKSSKANIESSFS